MLKSSGLQLLAKHCSYRCQRYCAGAIFAHDPPCRLFIFTLPERDRGTINSPKVDNSFMLSS
jgi:hypothetical protein